MHKYEPKTFTIPELQGLSAKQIEVHIKLYQGYVTHTNLIREKIAELETDKEKNAFIIAELRRRFSFEFDGMRMHEYYFEQFEGGASPLLAESNVGEIVAEKYGSVPNFIEHFKAVGMSRGIGWTILYYDPRGQTPHVTWVGDHELGQLAGLPVLCALDMWEHAYMVDYVPAEKKNYIEAFFKNVNWKLPEERLNAGR